MQGYNSGVAGGVPALEPRTHRGRRTITNPTSVKQRLHSMVVLAVMMSLAAVPLSTQAAAVELCQSQTAVTYRVATPPTGWNSWNTFGGTINETVAKRQADAMVSAGMLDAGYHYLVIDGGWRAATRDANKNMQPNPDKFPSGMKAMADYVHSHGLKIGLHQAVGMTDCGGLTPGTQSAPGGEQQDADTFGGLGGGLP